MNMEREAICWPLAATVKHWIPPVIGLDLD